MFQMTYFIGMPLSVGFYCLICKLFPPAGLGISESLPLNDDDDSVEDVISSEPKDVEKELK